MLKLYQEVQEIIMKETLTVDIIFNSEKLIKNII